MPIVSHVILVTDVPETPERVIEQWADGLKDNAERINAKRKLRIPDATAFNDRLATASIESYKDVLNPAFKSRAGLSKELIEAGQASNLRRSWKKYNSQIEHAFETVDGVEAKRFKDAVDRGTEEFAEGIAARTLPFSGIKAEGLGLTAIAALWLTGNKTVEGYLRAGDSVLEGGPYLICPHEKKPGLKAMLNQRLIQVGANIVKFEFVPSLMTALNQTTNEMVQGFVDPALDLIPFVAGGDSHVDYILVDSVLKLDIQISKMSAENPDA